MCKWFGACFAKGDKSFDLSASISSVSIARPSALFAAFSARSAWCLEYLQKIQGTHQAHEWATALARVGLYRQMGSGRALKIDPSPSNSAEDVPKTFQKLLRRATNVAASNRTRLHVGLYGYLISPIVEHDDGQDRENSQVYHVFPLPSRTMYSLLSLSSDVPRMTRRR